MSIAAEAAYVRALRGAELDLALSLIGPQPKDGLEFGDGLEIGDVPEIGDVLEIGAADGHVARILAGRFDRVAAVDVAVPARTRFPVQPYDGHRLPFDDDSFDLVYSSHVMEHVAHFDAFQAELARVLRPGGHALHVVPTAIWRFWTLVLHYPALPKLVLRQWRGHRAGGAAPGPGATGAGTRRRGPALAVMRLLAAAPHGETGSALEELRHFALGHWRRRFSAGGWRIVDSRPLGLCYSGYALFGGRLSLPARRRLARLAGSSSGCFLLRAPAAMP